MNNGKSASPDFSSLHLCQTQAAADTDGDTDRDLSVDSTVIRAHQHAAGVRRAPPPMSSKGPAVTEHQIDPARKDLAGHLMEKTRVPRISVGGPRAHPDSISADRAHSNGRTQLHLPERESGT